MCGPSQPTAKAARREDGRRHRRRRPPSVQKEVGVMHPGDESCDSADGYQLAV
jgi:hypothetical protein